jgi:hypothetical protein
LYALTEEVKRLAVIWQIATRPSLDHAVKIAGPSLFDYPEWEAESSPLLHLQTRGGGGYSGRIGKQSSSEQRQR